MYFLVVCVCSLEKCLFRSPARFLDWVVWLSDMELHELFVYFGDWPLVSCFVCNYFLPFCELSLCFTYDFLFWAKAFKFNLVPIVYFCFYFHYSKRWIQKDIAVIYVKERSVFSSRSFIVYSLTFGSLIHFEFIFVCGVRQCSNFILLLAAVHFPSTTSCRDCLFSTAYSCLCHRLDDHSLTGLSLGFLSCPIDLYFCPCASSRPSWILHLCNRSFLKSGSLIPPAPFFFLKMALSIRGLLCFQTNFKIICELLF